MYFVSVCNRCKVTLLVLLTGLFELVTVADVHRLSSIGVVGGLHSTKTYTRQLLAEDALPLGSLVTACRQDVNVDTGDLTCRGPDTHAHTYMWI